MSIYNIYEAFKNSFTNSAWVLFYVYFVSFESYGFCCFAVVDFNDW